LSGAKLFNWFDASFSLFGRCMTLSTSFAMVAVEALMQVTISNWRNA
jgi:hypothetical protein